MRPTVLLVFAIVWHFSYGRYMSNNNNFQRIGSKYYYISDDVLDWYDARDKCKRMDAHLVSIQNYNEWDAITDQLDCEDYWVDIRNEDDEFISETTGVEAAFLRWSSGQPKYKYNYDCVKIREGYRMKTKCCSQENYYICEANMRPAAPAPTTQKPKPKYDIVDLKFGY